MRAIVGVAALCVFAGLLVQGCQKPQGEGLPEPVGEAGLPPPIQPNTALPPNHPPLTTPSAPADPSALAANRSLPPGTRNPMEDIMAFKTRLEKDPKDLEALVSLANANMMISRFDAAQDLYRRALAVDPQNLEVRTNLAIAYKYGGKPEQAFAELQKNLAADPRHENTLYNLGFLYLYDKQDKRKAVETWNTWLRLYPEAPAAAEVRQQIAQIEADLTRSPARPSSGS
ncbi:MAG: tetratricopeptide repeat protein [Nitrospirota bacterium]